METLFNLPEKVRFCQKCVISNQRPASYPEFKHTRDRKNAKYMNFDEDGICDDIDNCIWQYDCNDCASNCEESVSFTNNIQSIFNTYCFE